MFGFLKRNKIISLHEQIVRLAELGIKLNSGISIDSLLDEFSQEQFEKDPYQLLLISMGGEIFKDDHFYVASDQIWHLDTECIEDHGDYISIIERLKKMTGIDINHIKDFVDVENETAWVSFEYNNKQIKWDLQINDDWLDPEIFDKFNQLVRDVTSKRLVISSLGQDCLIAYLTPEQLREINKLVKFKFE